MTKNHLKSLTAPRSWDIKRKEQVFVTKIRPGPHSIETSVPIAVFFKNMITLAKTTKEAKFILNNKTVRVNGIRRTKHDFPVGLFDIVSIDEMGTYYMVSYRRSGKLIAKEVQKKDAKSLMRIVDKTLIKGGKVQLNLHNGNNVFVDKDVYKTGDTVEITDNKITQHYKFQKKAPVFLIGGKHIGDFGMLIDINEDKIIYENASKDRIETSKKYAFIVGKEKPVISLTGE